MKMFKNSKKRENNLIKSLLLEYQQNMYFSSIEEILLYVTKKFSSKLKTPIYKVGQIDEFNRIIISAKVKYLNFIMNELHEFNINCYIGDLEDQETIEKRRSYIAYKFPLKDIYEEEEKLKINYQNQIKTSLSNYQPIILNILEKKEKPNNEILICISYEQYYDWSYIKKKLNWIAKKYFPKKPFFDIEEINKYNRIFFRSRDIKIIEKLNDKLNENNINTLILNNEEDLIPYRMKYIEHYYDNFKTSFLHTKWKLEYENNWYTKEKWSPMILIKKKIKE